MKGQKSRGNFHFHSFQGSGSLLKTTKTPGQMAVRKGEILKMIQSQGGDLNVLSQIECYPRNSAQLEIVQDCRVPPESNEKGSRTMQPL